MKKEYEHKQRLGICMSRTKNKTNSLKFPNIDYFSRKVISESRGTWDPPESFNKEAVGVCRCCVEFAQTGEWPSEDPACNDPSIDFDKFCTRRIDGSRGLGHFDYTQSGRDSVDDLLYILDHWEEPFYPASCLTDIGCSWGDGTTDVWPMWQDAMPCCVEGDLLPGDSGELDYECEFSTPLVCQLHDGNPIGSCEELGSCCRQGGGCEVMTECQCQMQDGSQCGGVCYWVGGTDCDQSNPCGFEMNHPESFNSDGNNDR